MMKIRMAKTVRPDLWFAAPGTILYRDMEYEAVSNQHGAISGICQSGERLGVKPGEFEFVGPVPAWIYDIWNENSPLMLKNAQRAE